MSDDEFQHSPVYFAGSDDPGMEQAMQRARQTFRIFWRELSWERRRIIPGLDLACVKVAFSDPPGEPTGDHPSVEQMWVNDIDFDGKHVTGTLINSPNWITSVKEGDHVNVELNRISDWMYAIQGKVYGAYTVNYMRSTMGRNERAEHDGAWGLDFGDPNEVRLVPPDYVGKSKGGLLTRLFGGGKSSASQDPEEVAGIEHPMALNMNSKLEEFVKEDPSNVTSADDRGFTLLHQLALAGAATGVELMLRHGADPKAKANNGMTPLNLAKSLGWKQVIAALEAPRQQ